MKPDLFVTKPFLPPLKELEPYLAEIWSSGQVTNCGKFHRELEDALCQHLHVPHLSLVNNGTIALMIALRALNLEGEVITTPYTFAATAQALEWNDLEPVFVDIDRETYNIDPSQIESAITAKTTAILAVHVYGRPCNIEAIQDIADRHGLRVIYDAAHAFGVDCDCGELLRAGDMSVLSFHATKVFNTFEGGAIISSCHETKVSVDRIKNFGFLNDAVIDSRGINGKMNEIQAAMGLVQLKYVSYVISNRHRVDTYYREALSGLQHIRIPSAPHVKQHNFSYFPIEITSNSSLSRDDVFNALAVAGVKTRKYFYPLVSNFAPYASLPSAHQSNLPIANHVSNKVICLPMYPELTEEDLERVVDALKKAV